MKIFALCGSIRSSSTNKKILTLIASHWKNEFELEIYSGLADLPHFNPDTKEDDIPFEVLNLREKIQHADGVIICTPEYVFSAPGALKNALEWMVSVTLFADKPTALIVASGLGEKTLESLTLILNTLGVKWSDETRLLIQGGQGKMDGKGAFTDADTFKSISGLIQSFQKLLAK